MEAVFAAKSRPCRGGAFLIAAQPRAAIMGHDKHVGAIAQLVERLVRKQIWALFACFAPKCSHMFPCAGKLDFAGLQRQKVPFPSDLSNTQIIPPGVTNGGDNFMAINL